MGYGSLLKVTECKVTETIGDSPTLEMLLLSDDELTQFLEVGSIITATPNKRDIPQAFVVEEITKPIDGVFAIYATHIAQHRAKLIPVSPFTASDLDTALTAVVSNSLETNPFTLVRDSGKNNVTATMTTIVPHSLRELMGGMEGSILDIYRGEWGFNNFTLTLYNKRGRDNGVQVMYGRNMTDFNLDEQFNWDSSVTGVIGYWIGDEGASVVISDVQYSPYATDYPYNKTICMDFSDRFESQPTKAQLDTYCANWISSKGLIGATVDVAFDHLDIGNGEDIGLGDTVHIYNSEYNLDMESRIVGTVYDVLRDEFETVTIGDLKTSLSEAIQETVGDSGSTMSSGTVEPSSTTPKMDGTADIGSEGKFARGDHVHPTDTSRVDKTGDTMTGNLGLRGGITLANTVGTQTTYSPQTGYYDTANVLMGSSRVLRTNADLLGFRIGPQRHINGSWVYNFLTLNLAADGTRSVQVSASAPWRKTIGPPVGDVIITSTNTNPSSNYGGTWTLIDKEFASTGETNRTSSVTLNSTNCDACNVYTWHSGHTIEFAIQVKGKVAITDTTIHFATLTPTNFGIKSGSNFSDARRVTQFSDAGNAIITWQLMADGKLNSLDGWVLQSNPSQSVTARQWDYFSLFMTVPYTIMDDNFCDKFYWKRTA